LAGTFYHDWKILSHDQFDSVDWISIHCTLHDLPQLFQVWATKHILGIAGTMKFLAHQDNRSSLCPSCQGCKKVAPCPEARRTLAFAQSMLGVELWLDKNSTHPNLWLLLLQYFQGRGALLCSKCSTALNLPHIIQEFAESQDIIGWDNFVKGKVSSKLLPIQSDYLLNSKSSSCATRWITGLNTQLLQVTHTQWIYQCVLVRNCTAGTLISAHKEELLKEIKHQLPLGPENLAEEDIFLLECNFGNLTTSTGEHQEYWLLAIQATREASCICTETTAAQQQQRSINTTQRRA
jgi:hypothetical protein